MLLNARKTSDDSKMRIAVIGAGLAGLCSLRHLTQHPDKFTVRGYEQTDHVGGTWFYTDMTGKDPHNGLPIHSSMYKNMRTNLPKEVMCFPDYPFDSSLPSFIHHSDVLQYLNNYAIHYNLLPHIQFNSQVVSVEPISDSLSSSPFDDVSWSVTIRDVISNDFNVEIYDIIFICNGHYFKPYISVPGLDYFKGSIYHSHDYRTNDPFKDQNVLIVGGGNSGTDISLEVCEVAASVYVSHDKTYLSSMPGNLHQVPRVSSVSPSGVTIQLENGGCIDGIDSIVLCTGYEYQFDFLGPNCGIKITNNRVHSLYKHLINTEHPSMVMIGLNFTILPSVITDCQVQYYMSVLLGKTTLPTKEQMKKDEDDDCNMRLKMGFKPRQGHMLGDLQWDYCHWLGERGGFVPFKQMVEEIFKDIAVFRRYNLQSYKRSMYNIMDDGKWTHFDK